MRIFFALGFDAPVLDALEAAQARLEACAASLRRTRRENLHLTLAFLGEQPPGRVAEAERALAGLDVPELSLVIEGAGVFRREGGDLWWAGLRRDEGLWRLQRALSARLEAAGFAPEARAFRPHLTLARQVVCALPPDARALLPEPIPARCGAVSLMASCRERGMLIYKEICRKEAKA